MYEKRSRNRRVKGRRIAELAEQVRRLRAKKNISRGLDFWFYCKPFAVEGRVGAAHEIYARADWLRDSRCSQQVSTPCELSAIDASGWFGFVVKESAAARQALRRYERRKVREYHV